MLYIQLIGVLAFCVWILSYYRKEVRDILIFQSASNALYFIHYLLLGALSGAYLSVIGILRNIFFLIFKKSKKIVGFVFIIAYILITIVFYEGLHSLIPMFAGSIYIIYMLKDEKLSLIKGELACKILWITYNIFVHSYSGIITETILLVSCVVQIIKIKSTKK